MMDVVGKTKDNDKAKIDLAVYCKRLDLEMKELPNGKLLKLKADHGLTTNEEKSICQRLKYLRMQEQ